jgi:hypothetical protein
MNFEVAQRAQRAQRITNERLVYLIAKQRLFYLILRVEITTIKNQ